jgi:AcrR family transcriptional regulator
MTARSPGRPRSESARRAVLAATAALVERDGYGRVTMEAIARRAGVSKQTVYRWWPSKAAIIVEALSEGAVLIAPAPDTGSLRADLERFLRATVAGAERNAHLLGGLMAEAQLDEAFGASFREGFLARRREVLRELLDHARDRGELAPAADTEFLAELVFAMVWYRILARPRPLDRRFAHQLTRAVLALAS